MFMAVMSVVSNPEVDVIYVATPHGLHASRVLLCLQHKKAVLCEKAFAINYRQANEMIHSQKRKNIFNGSILDALSSAL
jgi:predicted dehydrogenase